MAKLEIEFTLSEHDDGYHVADWFSGGLATIEAAKSAASAEEAGAILRDAYLGADKDGVEVEWKVAA